jgi:NAD(P)H dehydrogenase (quinone)
MRVLVVYSHPVETSYNAALHAEVVRNLTGAGHEVDDCDLYAEDFNPVLSRAERLGYHDVPENQAPVRRYVERLQNAEALVLCFPTWCFGLPAMLKGWLDRVWATDVAFKLPAGKGRITSLMTHVTKVGVITTCGAPTWWSVVVGQPGRKTLLRGMRALCARRCKTFFLAHYLMDASTPRTRAAFLVKVRAKLERF